MRRMSSNSLKQEFDTERVADYLAGHASSLVDKFKALASEAEAE